MCGIVGFVGEIQEAEMILRKMTDALSHRGPDSDGLWLGQSAALGHRRLAIIDLSEQGYQPMFSPTGRYVTTFNGEIYNFQSIRQQLESAGQQFRGHSDTEVMLAAIECWGFERAIQSFVGMFAVAVWDQAEKSLYIARDRMGEKPLYYGWMGDAFLFGSELKALRQHPAWQADINRDALAMMLRYNYVPTPYSIYQGVYKLPPATWLKIEDWPSRSLPKPQAYWSVAEIQPTPSHLSPDEVVNELESLLTEAIKGQMISDVPLGAFLSGGIDSSSIVALMQAQSQTPVRTFSIGFEEAVFNEAPYAKKIAQHLGTDHTEFYLNEGTLLEIVPKLPVLYDEPFSDSSQIPTHLVCQLARQHVTVALSGDGGDELFAGYQRYSDAFQTYQMLKKIPAQSLLAKTIEAVPFGVWARTLKTLAPLSPTYLGQHDAPDKLLRLAQMLPLQNPSNFYLNVMSHWQQPEQVVLGAGQTIAHQPDFGGDLTLPKMARFDMTSYLLDDILVKVDRASMGVALELRVPLLNHHVVEFALRQPSLTQRPAKWALRQILAKYVPLEMFDRPKMGFGVPLVHWLRHELRDWGEALLDERRLRQEGLFNPAPIRRLWEDHLAGRGNWHHHLWDVLMVQQWYEAQMN